MGKRSFEIWDAVGVQKGIELAKEAGYEVSDWVKNVETFYKVNDEGQSIYVDKNSGIQQNSWTGCFHYLIISEKIKRFGAIQVLPSRFR
jgi:3-hydroxyacyl-CoA dehydrogenase